MRYLGGLVFVVALAAITTPAFAWGPEGHAIVADIAAAHLNSTAAGEVQRLLAKEGHSSLDQVSSWPDEIRNAQPDTGPWHFVDIPLNASAYDAARDCHYDKDNNHVAEETCIIAKLPEQIAILSDKTKSDAERLDALKYVVHFVGDIHQPLHAEDNNDRGGNDVHLTYFGKATKLHAIWDGGIIEKHYGWTLGPNFSFDHQKVAIAAGAIDNLIPTAKRGLWAPPGLLSSMDATATSWANETHALAPAAYSHVPKKKMGKAYQKYAWPVVLGQLERAGVRLAEILNEALR